LELVNSGHWDSQRPKSQASSRKQYFVARNIDNDSIRWEWKHSSKRRWPRPNRDEFSFEAERILWARYPEGKVNPRRERRVKASIGIIVNHDRLGEKRTAKNSSRRLSQELKLQL
jgi:hypothetical protein